MNAERKQKKLNWAELLKQFLGVEERPYIDLTKPIEDVKHPTCDIVIDED